MAEDGAPGTALQTFAQRHGLKAGVPQLPAEGDLLGRNGDVEEGATGRLAEGLDGSIADYTYTYEWTDSDHHTHTEVRKFTMVVTRVPQSIGFVPYLMFSGSSSKMGVDASGSAQQVKLEEGDALDGTTLYAYEGTSHQWLTQLFSPALIDWLARSADDFGFELSDGVLVVSRGGYLSSHSDLESLCSDASHIATALRKESLEELQTGGAKTSAAKETDKDTAKALALVGKVELSSTPEDVSAAKGELHSHALRSGSTFGSAFLRALLIMLVINFFGVAVPIVAAVNGAVTPLLIGEAALFLIIFLFAYRSYANKISENGAREAFFQSYAQTRKLKLEDPLQFAATHAEAGIPFKPEHVVSGSLPGGRNASMAWEGTGAKRSDRIAVIGGPKGPIASAELKSSTPVLSASDLDRYAEQLGAELGAGGGAAA